jgi:phosphohistidine phosphatase SixA
MMRHAKSAWNFEGMEDKDRPLNARGRKSAVAVSQELVYTRRCLPTLVLSSNARRTQVSMKASRRDCFESHGQLTLISTLAGDLGIYVPRSPRAIGSIRGFLSSGALWKL